MLAVGSSALRREFWQPTRSQGAVFAGSGSRLVPAFDLFGAWRSLKCAANCLRFVFRSRVTGTSLLPDNIPITLLLLPDTHAKRPSRGRLRSSRLTAPLLVAKPPAQGQKEQR